MNRWNTPLKDLMREVKSQLYFTRTERRGIWLLCLITLGFGIAPYAVAWLFPRPIPPAMSLPRGVAPESAPDQLTSRRFVFDPNTASKEELVALGIPPPLAQRIHRYCEKGGKFKEKKALKKIYGFPEKLYRQLEPFIAIAGEPKQQAGKAAPSHRFPFDPNTASESDLRRWGLPEKVVRNILSYREKGGRFRQRKDMARMYGLTEALYLELEPYLLLPQEQGASTQFLSPEPAYSHSVPPTRRPSLSLDINQAAIEEWQQLHGIGPTYARRIVAFRDKLGGFYSVEQVKETYGLPDSTFQKILPRLKASPVLRNLRINTATAAELSAHPYITKNLAQIIVNYRDQHGPFHSPEELRQIRALTPEMAARIMPYIAVD